ncbi:MAG: phosphotransferase [Actinomycetia bacterium]|nr:phosphotransferase [Actinomycetes bacterium]
MTDPVTDLDSIDATWLTSALAEAGVADGASVAAVEARSIGTGQVGENVRFTLTWSEDRPDLPGSVVGKFPSTSEVSLAAAAATETYVREVGFYRDLQAEVDIPTPHVFRIEEDLATNRFLLLMEDIRPAEQGDQLGGCDLAQAELAVDAAAGLHASTWARATELAELSWLDLPSADAAVQWFELYRALFDGFVERYADQLTDDQIGVGRWIGEHLPPLWEAALSVPLCLAHHDFRLDNMLFGVGEGAPPLTVVDWQTARLGSGPADVAYFVGAGLLADDRRSHEQTLVDRYTEGLARRGVAVDHATIDLGYRVGATSGYIMAVIASQMVEQTDRGDTMFVAMASRHTEQILDLDVAALVGGTESP